MKEDKMIINIDKIISKTRKVIEKHALSSPGCYTRWLWQIEGKNRQLGNNEYGVADAANTLYMLGDFQMDKKKRTGFADTLKKFQNPETGMFVEATHHTIHTTAHCAAAIELFDEKPMYVPKDIEQYLDTDKLCDFLKNLNWAGKPWTESHKGAGVYSSFFNCRMAGAKWRKAFVDFLTENCDKEYGMSMAGAIQTGKAPVEHHLFGWFHYMFCLESANAPIPLPEKLIDTCIDLYKNSGFSGNFHEEISFRQIDWVFAVNRASRQTPHRFAETKALLRDFAVKYLDFLHNLDEDTHDGFNDLHILFGAMCAVAELQLALPGEIESEFPLKSVLDRRPFI